MTTSANLDVTHLVENQDGAELVVNDFINRMDALVLPRVVNRITSATPGSPTNGDMYIIGPETITGTWDTDGRVPNDLAYYYDGWLYTGPEAGMVVFDLADDCYVYYDGSSWAAYVPMSWKDNISASATQSQGQAPLTYESNRVTTVGVTNDVVTLPAAVGGRRCLVVNEGANTLQVFPASGAEIDNLGANNSTTIAANAQKFFIAANASNWYTV